MWSNCVNVLWPVFSRWKTLSLQMVTAKMLCVGRFQLRELDKHDQNMASDGTS